MPLSVGTRIGPYEVTGTLGSGGMGEVYRARDTRLGRDVALKVLPEHFASNAERLARFEREARTLAQLNHPHVASIYGFEVAPSTGSGQAAVHALAMELVDGHTLGDRIAAAPLPLKETLRVARQIADALDAAHERGIVHRDLKPANIKLTPDGVVKVLDFGLAKSAEEAGTPALTDSPTITSVNTQHGVVLGTAAYMSPEQARGRVVDKRTDLWAFGCVLYEMLTGRMAFGRQTASDTLVAILEREPDMAALPASVPPRLRRLIARLLEKDQRSRLRDIGDAKPELSDAVLHEGPADAVRGGPATTRWLVVAVAAAIAGGVLGVGGWWLGRRSAPVAETTAIQSMFSLTTDPGYEGEPSFSPDGGTIVYVTDRTGNFEIVRRQMSGGAELNLTNDQADDVQPVFSPDGQSIAFVSSRGRRSRLKHEGYDLPLMAGSIWVMPALGGTPRRVVEEGSFPSWSPDGATILYSTGIQFANKIMVAPAIGGTPREIPLTFPRSRPRYLLYPRYSADARRIVFEADSPVGFGPRDIYLAAAEGGAVQHLGNGMHPVWSADSRSVIYSSTARGTNYSLWQVPISTDMAGPPGTPRPLTLSRGRDLYPAVSRDGRQLAFSGVEFSFNAEAMPFDAETGRATGPPVQMTHGNSVTYFQSFSPDGNSIAYESRLGTTCHLWRVDRSGVATQLTADPTFEDTFPRWNPAGETIAFSRRLASDPGGTAEIWLVDADGGNPRRLIADAGLFSWLGRGTGIVYFSRADSQLYLYTMATGQSRRLTNEPRVLQILSGSADGEWVVYQVITTDNIDLRALRVAGGEPKTVVATPEHDYHPFLSPSGRWLYFQINHENFYRVPGPAQGFRPAQPERVTSFAETGLLLDDPQWSPDGRFLLYSHGRRPSDIWLATLK